MKRSMMIVLLALCASTGCAQWVPMSVNTNTGEMKPVVDGVTNNISNYGTDAYSLTNLVNGGTSGSTGQITGTGRSRTITFPNPSEAVDNAGDAFFAYCTNYTTSLTTSYSDIIWQAEAYDDGGNFSGSTYKVPADGTYMFQYHLRASFSGDLNNTLTETVFAKFTTNAADICGNDALYQYVSFAWPDLNDAHVITLNMVLSDSIIISCPSGTLVRVSIKQGASGDPEISTPGQRFLGYRIY